MNTARKITKKTDRNPVIYSIFKKAEEERNQTDEMFKLLGWNSLPADLKFEIEEDVRGYYEELHGFYSTSCEYVQRRRESVDFWVRSFKDGLCTLQTAVESLRVNRI